uniref:RRM domain-containing protein n=1 Tax=Mesocestoides corti TaxID=53468 RepID=A0A5K3EUH9_MESCO
MSRPANRDAADALAREARAIRSARGHKTPTPRTRGHCSLTFGVGGMFIAPDGVRSLDLTLGSLFGCGAQPGCSENVFLNRLLYLAATGYGLRKRGHDLSSENSSAVVRLSAKRPRVEGGSVGPSAPPSRVLHVRGLPAETAETDIVKLAMPFGPIANLVLTKKTGQALIEMANQEIATQMLEYYQFYPPLFNGGSESAILQYSKYQTLEISGISRPVSDAIAMANDHFLRFVVETPTRPRVLRVFLEPAPTNQLNYMDYFKIFYRHGAILRIIVFKMSGRSQAFVEFNSPVSAHAALLTLNGQMLPMYGAKMRIEFSRQTSLELRQDDNTSRDFVAQPLSALEEQDLIKSLTPM